MRHRSVARRALLSPSVALAVAAAVAVCATAPPLAAQQDFSKVEIKTSPLREGIHLLIGAGGNMVA
ncbi:MAG: hypothetical protein ACRCTI_09630, partial [Beijerinckiaceae bacterium]